MADLTKSDAQCADEQQVAYLQLIEGVIDRMSTASAIYKGFASAALAGVVTVSFAEIEWYVLAVLALPMLGLMALDLRHLRIERFYRSLYDAVRAGEHPVDFDLRVPCRAALHDGVRCLCSWSIWLFYAPFFCAWFVLTAFRFFGIG